MALDLIWCKTFGIGHSNVGRGLTYFRISFKLLSAEMILIKIHLSSAILR